jgi:hypothetical protein
MSARSPNYDACFPAGPAGLHALGTLVKYAFFFESRLPRRAASPLPVTDMWDPQVSPIFFPSVT